MHGDEIYKKLARMLGASHKRLNRPCRFPPEMISDLYVEIHDKKDAARPHGCEHTYCRKWIDGWVLHWYYENRGTQTEEQHHLTKALPAPSTYREFDLDADEKWEVRDLMHELSDRHREVISLYFGIDGDGVYTLTEIGARFNMSGARIGQILHDALEKFTIIAYRNKLIPGVVSADQWCYAARQFVGRRMQKNQGEHMRIIEEELVAQERQRAYGSYASQHGSYTKRDAVKARMKEIKRVQALLLWKRLNNDSTAHIEESRLLELQA